MGMPAATRSVGHSQTHTHSHAHTLPRRILANLSQITVEHAHAAEKELETRQEKELAGTHTTGQDNWRNINSHFRDFNCPLHVQHAAHTSPTQCPLAPPPPTCAPITQLFSCDPNRTGAIIAGHCRCPLPFLMLLTKFNWPLNDFNCATDVAHKLQRKLPTTIAAVATHR